MQVIEKIIDTRLGSFAVPIQRCPKEFNGNLNFHIYDSIRGSCFVISGDYEKIASYIEQNNVLCTIGNYPIYFTMSRDAVRLYESQVIDYITTRPSSSKPKLCVVAMSSNNLFIDVEFSKSYRVGTNVYDLLLDSAELVGSSGDFVLNSVYSTLEVIYNIKNINRVNKLIVKHQILNKCKSDFDLLNNK